MRRPSTSHGGSGGSAGQLPEAINITPNQKHELMTTRSWDFLGLKNEPPSELLQRTNYGEDIIIGKIGTDLLPFWRRANGRAPGSSGMR
uniref:Uncharacterized protein n=1 Tax=Oryza glumipatula TaxID=40148 RepID=A0A0D9ZWG9_9ORYZ